MLNLSIKQDVKNFFFDRKYVADRVDAMNRRNLSRMGAFIRTRATTSMKYRKLASEPGTPPSAHKEHGATLRKRLFFAFDPSTTSVAVGPERLGKGEAPALNEFGGTATRTRVLYSIRKAATPAQATAYRRKVLSGEIKPPARQRIQYLAKYPARPYMGPALQKEIKAGTVSEIYRDSLRS